MPDIRSRLEQQGQGLSQMPKRIAEARAAATDTSEWVEISAITIDERIQVRVGGLNPEIVERYATVMKESELGYDAFEPIVLFQTADGKKLLSSGFHRVGAAQKAEFTKVRALTRMGEFEDAYWFAITDNLAHGLQLTRADQKESLRRLLGYGIHLEQSATYRTWSSRKLAGLIGVSHPTIETWRQEFESSLTGKNFPVEETEGKIQASDNIRVGVDGRPIRVDRIRRANIKRAKPKPPAPTESSVPPTPGSPGGIIRDTVVSLLHEHGSLAASELRELLEAQLGKRLDAGLFFGAINGLCATGVIVPRQPGLFALPEGIGDQPPAGDDAYQDVIPPMGPESTPASGEPGQPVDNYDTPAMQDSIRQAAIIRARDTAISLRRIGEHKAAQDFERVASFWAEHWGLG
jgi:hypothetical protein